ncbi:Glucan 1,3-beta-glucosidase [Rasamsonia emersonii CBS 393.64]|uniref:Glucan 1,3-beta-glucosidase n=1 Tax=Rasamsonia emersonii (strain ATCC 16479 / CBS 393.64 / IMI 116815) TaxID=1408163 RepID=A0A0F4YEG0_RASE3|nr:Glucan 1,3-beta-glucosidase [Rasamsonia emersonii CBS 393.64]KKA16281.1 Glucan 1,3-beta-glucosidase [Rasamsonia emersonii CBS 393.64]
MLSRISVFIIRLLLFLGLSAFLVEAAPMPLDITLTTGTSSSSSGYWVANIKRQGTVAFGNSTDYQIFRNVKDFGAKGDGITDDTAAINEAVSSGNRCGQGCDSSTVTPAIVYFPPGTYIVSKPIIQYYYTQFIGDALDLPVLKASPQFTGMAVIDSDPYDDSGSNWYTNQNNFFRSVRNFVIDLTAMPQGSGAGIHWQVGQATSLQNIRFEMVRGGGDANKQQGIFMDNGSGGFMSDLVFNGGNYGMFLGNQQFTTRNLTFNDCNTAVFMNWNWAWTFKSVTVNNCGVALNMSNSPSNQTVGSVMLLDSTISTTQQAIVTAWSTDSIPVGGGTLGNTYTPSGKSSKAKRAEQALASLLPQAADACPAPQVRTITIVKTLPVATGTQVETAVPAPSPSAVTQGGAVPASAVTSAAGGAVPAPSPAASETTGAAPIVTPAASSPSEAGSPATSVHGSAGSVVTSPAAASEPSPLAVSIGVNVPGGSSVASSPAAATHSAQSAGQSSIAISLSLGLPPATATSSAHGGTSTGTCSNAPASKARIQKAMTASTKPQVLLDGQGKVFERSRPLYENYDASSFVSVKSAGAKGDGVTDDTEAIQKVLDSVTENQIVYFDHGAYVITNTIKVPKNIKITGEIWPLLMASGKAFADEKNPIPMLQIGQPGDTGSVEISDLILETKGPAPGAILMEWNVAEATQGSVGMWDVHFRVGGTAGTELQSNTCAKDPTSTAAPKSECIGAFMMFHATEKASAYVENSWFWTADHDLDMPDHGQIDIYNGRGVLIESQGPVWLYGTASEHNQLYNYQIHNAQNVYMAMIQSETPYYQANPNALTPFTPQTSWNDPDFSTCTTDSCRKSWGLRVMNSSDLYVYGAGLYSFFDNYSQTCLATESCQENMVEVDCSDVHLYGLSTKASTNMVTSSSGEALVLQSDNVSNFCSTIALFQQT